MVTTSTSCAFPLLQSCTTSFPQ